MTDTKSEGASVDGASQSEAPDDLLTDGRAFKRGRWRMLLTGGVIFAGVVALGMWMITEGGTHQAYGAVGQSVNGVRESAFDGFWACTLGPQQAIMVRNNRQMTDALHRRAFQGGAQYAAHVKNQCMSRLDEVGPELSKISAPEALVEPLQRIESATVSLKTAMVAYIDYVAKAGPKYNPDSDQARGLVINVTRGWYDYRQEHAALNRAIADELR